MTGTRFGSRQVNCSMTRSSSARFWSGVIYALLLFRSVWTSICHVENQFVKLEGTFPSIAPIKVTTAIAVFFCSVECTEILECKSFAFLTTMNTDNCHLGSSSNGLATSTAAEVYQMKSSKQVQGCASSPCLNGGVCTDLCDEPYYICACPSDKQGDNCEWDISYTNVDWYSVFDHGGTHTCPGNTFMAGFQRSTCAWIHCLDTAVCGPLSIEFSQSSLSCQNGWWWDSFATNSWSWCPPGMLLRGFYRNSGSNDLGYIEEGVCCHVPGSTHSDCYYQDVGLIFDHDWATASCNRPLYFIHGIRTSHCPELGCIEELYCCYFKEYFLRLTHVRNYWSGRLKNHTFLQDKPPYTYKWHGMKFTFNYNITKHNH